MLNKQRFMEACEAVKTAERAAGGIGTLGERTLHMVLKRYFEPNESMHEIKVGGFVADIVQTDGIIEIQTRNFDKLRKKLDAFLRLGPVTVVYPIAAIKRLRWIDMQAGEISAARKSPRQGMVHDVLPELYKIKPFLTHPNFRLCVVMLDLDELRYRNGWSKDGKSGSERCDRIPNELLEELYFQSSGDYRSMLPEALPAEFLAKDFQAASKLGRYHAGLAVNTLCALGAIHVIGKIGKAYIYGQDKNEGGRAPKDAPHITS